MKKPTVDYSDFSFKKLTNPKYRHLLLFIGWAVYLVMYFVTENLIPEDRCHVVHSVVDDMIPFNEYFVLFYVSWYFLIVGSILIFLLYDVESFSSMQKFIIFTQFVAVVIYIVWPSVQYLRPASFERSNFCTFLLGLIYSADTPTGVCPSLHVAYSVGIASTWLKKRDAKPVYKFLICLWILGICMSVCFVKQHSFVDVMVAIPICIAAEIFVFGKKYWKPLIKAKKM